MKFNVIFKTPDVTWYALQDSNLSEGDKEKAKEVFKKFIKNDEQITVEFDTEAGTATVKQR